MHFTNPSSQAIQAPPYRRRKASRRSGKRAFPAPKTNGVLNSPATPLDREGGKPVGQAPMISSIRVENFRCFKSLDIADLGRINLIVGECGAGKTALLESIFLPGSNPDILQRYLNLRGLPIPQLPVWTRNDFEALWSPFFYQFCTDNTPSIKLTGNEHNQRSVQIYFDKSGIMHIPSDQLKTNDPKQLALRPVGALSAGSSSSLPLVFKTVDDAGNNFEVKLVFDFNNREFAVVGDAQPNAKISFFPAGLFVNVVEVAEQFSGFNKRGEGQKFSDIMHSIFPMISNISSEFSVGKIPILHCSVTGLKEKIPISLVSSGINRLITILLGIASSSGGVVLIDELENGFYYKSLPKVWEAISVFSAEYKTQIFASTHGKECLDAFLPMLSKDNSIARLIRVQAKNDGEHIAKVSKGRVLEAELETGDVDPRSGESP
jgi:AAA15 family ATPase/GTPase